MVKLEDITQEKTNLREELLEKVYAIKADSWEHTEGSYELGPRSLEDAAMKIRNIIEYTGFATKLGPYDVQLREEGFGDMTLNFLEKGNEEPKLCLEGTDIKKLYATKKQEIKAYEEKQSQKEEKRLQESNRRWEKEKLQREIDGYKDVLDQI